MVNYYDKHKFVSKKLLAELVKPNARLLPPQAVKYICEDYCIDLPQELQDPQVINKSPMYKKIIREIQLGTFFEGEWMKITEIPHDF